MHQPTVTTLFARALSSAATGIEVIKRHPLITIGAFVLAVFGTVVTVQTYLSKAVDYYDTRLTDRDLQSRLNQVDIRLGVEKIRSLMGTPAVSRDLGWRGLAETVFEKPDVYKLQLIHKADGEIVFYSVLSQDSNFHPVIPGSPQSRLGETTYAGAADLSPEIVEVLATNHVHYIEKSGGSRANDFRVLYLAYEHARGVDYAGGETQANAVIDFLHQAGAGEVDTQLETFRQNPSAWRRFRAEHRPNGFAVADQNGFSDKTFQHTHFGGR